MWPVIIGLVGAGAAGAIGAMAENRFKAQDREDRIIRAMIKDTPQFSDRVDRRLTLAAARVKNLQSMGFDQEAVATMVQEIRDILDQDHKVPMLSHHERTELTEMHDDLVAQS